jgi:hypothetical protein
MPSRIVATLTARRTVRGRAENATIHLTSSGVILRHGDGVKEAFGLRGADDHLLNFSEATPEDCLAALRAAVAKEGWEVA